MFKSMFIEFFYDLVLQNLDIHNASGARDGPPRPRPLKMGERFVPGFKRRRVVISRLLLSILVFCFLPTSKFFRGLLMAG